MDWLNRLPDHMRPPLAIAQELEDFRRSLDCPAEPFAMRVRNSAWAVRRDVQHLYRETERELPDVNEASLVMEEVAEPPRIKEPFPGSIFKLYDHLSCVRCSVVHRGNIFFLDAVLPQEIIQPFFSVCDAAK